MKTTSRGCAQLLICHCNRPAVKLKREAASARNWKNSAPGSLKSQPKTLDLFFAPLLANINTQLLGLFVEMATLQAECPCGIRHVKACTFQFGENYLALESLHAVGKRS